MSVRSSSSYKFEHFPCRKLYGEYARHKHPTYTKQIYLRCVLQRSNPYHLWILDAFFAYSAHKLIWVNLNEPVYKCVSLCVCLWLRPLFCHFIRNFTGFNFIKSIMQKALHMLITNTHTVKSIIYTIHQPQRLIYRIMWKCFFSSQTFQVYKPQCNYTQHLCCEENEMLLFHLSCVLPHAVHS